MRAPRVCPTVRLPPNTQLTLEFDSLGTVRNSPLGRRSSLLPPPSQPKSVSIGSIDQISFYRWDNRSQKSSMKSLTHSLKRPRSSLKACSIVMMNKFIDRSGSIWTIQAEINSGYSRVALSHCVEPLVSTIALRVCQMKATRYPVHFEFWDQNC